MRPFHVIAAHIVALSVPVAQVLGFERAVEAGRWAEALDFVWPAKITTRWTPPFDSWHWTPPPAPACPRPESIQVIAAQVEGRWARVRVAACPAVEHELWLLELDGRWKILRRVDVPLDGVADNEANASNRAN